MTDAAMIGGAIETGTGIGTAIVTGTGFGIATGALMSTCRPGFTPILGLTPVAATMEAPTADITAAGDITAAPEAETSVIGSKKVIVMDWIAAEKMLAAVGIRPLTIPSISEMAMLHTGRDLPEAIRLGSGSTAVGIGDSNR